MKLGKAIATAVLSVAASALLAAGLATAADGFVDLYSLDGKLIQARVIKVESGKADLVRKSDGKRFSVPLDRFDEATRRMLDGDGSPAGGLFEIDPEFTTGDKRLYPRTQGEILEAMAEIKAHAEAQSSFSEGERGAVYQLNVYRYLAGLSFETKLDRGLCQGAVTAANGCEKIGRMDHGANAEANKCNLHHSGNLPASIHGYMNDGGSSNRKDRAHRQWCLSPKLGKLGVGASAGAKYCAMWTMDRSASGKIKGDFFAYPSPGYYPASYLKGSAWTVYFPGKSRPAKEDLQVKVWQIDEPPDKPLRPGVIPAGGQELEVRWVSTSKWVTPCVNFEPAAKVEAGKRYWVSIKGGDFKAAFLVEFFKS